MTDQPTPETDAEIFLRPQFRFNPADMAYKFARALEIQRNAARADAARLLSELADERAKKSDALIAAVDDIERLTAERDAKQSQLKEVNSWLDECVKQRDDSAALAKNYAERMKRSDAELSEARALLGLLADIRAAVGDPTGRLMQDELVERCRKLRAERDSLSEALERNCVQYVQKQQALIAERDALRAELKTAKAERDRALDEAAKEGA